MRLVFSKEKKYKQFVVCLLKVNNIQPLVLNSQSPHDFHALIIVLRQEVIK